MIDIRCGDAFELLRTIEDKSIDLVLTDPPFGIDFDYGDEYKDDRKTYIPFIERIIQEANRIIKPGGLCFIFVAQPRLDDIWSLFPKSKRIFAACRNFTKLRAAPTVFHAWEPVIFWQSEGPRLIKRPTGRDFHVANTANTNGRSILADVPWHPCPRPLDTITYMVENFCPEGGLIADFFSGSGTIAVVAYLTRRSCVAFEQSQHYVTKSLERLELAKSPPLFAQVGLELCPL